MTDDPDFPQAPPSAEHTNLPADASVWAAAQRSYVEDGLSCPVVAERHGLQKRTVQHHAATEGWPALRAAHVASDVRRRREAHRADELDDPAAQLVQDLRADRLADLLVHVSGDALVREAARLAAEAAADRRPQEALLWLRAVREAERVGACIDRALAGRDPADAFRTVYLQGAAASVEAGLRDAADEGEPPKEE